MNWIPPFSDVGGKIVELMQAGFPVLAAIAGITIGVRVVLRFIRSQAR